MELILDMLENSVGKEISLLMRDNRILEGKLRNYDSYMNLTLEEAEERSGEKLRRLGTVIIRGNSILSIGI